MMKIRLNSLAIVLLLTVSAFRLGAQNNTAETQTPEEMAATVAEYLIKYLDLDDHQAYQIEVELQEVYPRMIEEVKAVRRGGANSAESYDAVYDKWYARLDSTYQKVFTEKQWARYLKSPYGREKKARDKRIRKRGGLQ